MALAVDIAEDAFLALTMLAPRVCISSRDLGKRFALDDRMVHIWKLGVATPDHHISHVIHRQAKVMGDLPGGAILVQASEGKDVVLRQGGRVLRTNPCVGM